MHFTSRKYAFRIENDRKMQFAFVTPASSLSSGLIWRRWRGEFNLKLLAYVHSTPQPLSVPKPSPFSHAARAPERRRFMNMHVYMLLLVRLCTLTECALLPHAEQEKLCSDGGFQPTAKVGISWLKCNIGFMISQKLLCCLTWQCAG